MPDLSLDDPNDEVKLVLRLRQFAGRKSSPYRRIRPWDSGGLVERAFDRAGQGNFCRVA